MRRGFFDPQDRLKVPLEDLINKKGIMLSTHYNDRKECIVLCHSGDTPRDSHELPEPDAFVHVPTDKIEPARRFDNSGQAISIERQTKMET